MNPWKILTLSTILGLTGCASPDHMFVATDTSLGVNGNINSTRTSGKVVIGYDRKFIAYVPQKTEGGDAMSAFNCTNLEITGITVTKFHERLATGEAAQKLVHSLLATGAGNECVFP